MSTPARAFQTIPELPSPGADTLTVTVPATAWRRLVTFADHAGTTTTELLVAFVRGLEGGR